VNWIIDSHCSFTLPNCVAHSGVNEGKQQGAIISIHPLVNSFCNKCSSWDAGKFVEIELLEGHLGLTVQSIGC
jgi:hypothetical protein